MLIDTTDLPKFGTMTSGAGLAAIFDGLPSTTGYAQTPIGYAGVELLEPKRIAFAEVSSPSNGFDASNSKTGIALQLYGKNGAAPTSPTDGTLLGEVGTFTDQNVERAVTIPSTDSYTAYQYVWVKVHTGIWAVASEIRLYEDVSGVVEMPPIGPGSRSMVKSCDVAVPLTFTAKEITEFKIRFRLAERRQVKIDFHADVKHVGTGAESSMVSGFSFRLYRRESSDLAALSASPLIFIKNAVSGGNVSEETPQHYGNTAIPAVPNPSDDPETSGFLEPGYHEIVVFGSGHSRLTSTNLLQMLVEGGQGLNALIVTVQP